VESGRDFYFYNKLDILAKKIMKRKKYEKPSLEEVELRQQTSLLQNSVTDSVDATMTHEWTEEDI